MTDRPSAHIFDATPDNFERLVLGNSGKGLVLVHFWSPKAGPCMLLMPRLVQLAVEYGGRFLLVMANTLELGHQARTLGVTSVPTVKFFLAGQVVHTIHGAESDAVFRTALGQFLAREEDRERQAALALHQAGHTGEAISQLARLAVERPDDLAVAVDLAKLLTLAGRHREALDLLSALPPSDRAAGVIAPLLAHLELLQAANEGPEDAEARLAADPEDHDARLALAARALFEDQTETALDQFLELARRAPDFRNDLGRRAMLALFAMLGGPDGQDETGLVRRYRSMLAALRR